MLLCGFALTASAVPARRGWQTRTQADGTTIEVQQVGDEFYHYWMTKDGKIAELQEDGTVVVTDRQRPSGQEEMLLRKASRRYVNRAKKIGASSLPARGLFILVNFTDQSFSTASANYYQSSLGDATEGAKSMYNYLKEQSGGQYAPPIDVFGPVTLSRNVSYYGSNDSNGDDKHPAQMVKEACELLNDQIDFSLYDANNDGKVDNVYIIYAGKGEADGGASTTIWPHQWDLYSAEGITLNLDGKQILTYACSSELSGNGIYAMGTPLHEFSHVLGLPDYYDTEYESTNYSEGRTPNEWSLMDAGSYNDNGLTPPNYSIFDKYFLGWATPQVLAKNAQLDITLTTGQSDGYQINGGTSLLAATNTTTMYYIENRQQTGWDAALPGHGMIVWRVMYNESKWENNELNNTSGTTRYTVWSASGNQKNIGKASDPFPGSTNTTSWTPFTGCALSSIAEQNGLISFKYNGGAPVVVDPFDVQFMAYGRTFATVQSTGSLVLPATDPVACSDGRVFVGWCSQASYSSPTTAPTFAKAGDAVAEGATFYAVFADEEGEGGAPQNTTYTFTTKAWADATNSWTSNQDGTAYLTDKNGVQISTGSTGAGAETKAAMNGVSKVVVKYCTNAKAGVGSISVSVGTNEVSHDVTKTGGSALRDLEYTFNNASGKVAIAVTCTTNSIYVNSVTVTTGGGSSYSNYSTSCEHGTGIEDTCVEPKAKKVIRNGQVLILRDGRTYNVLGVSVE